jgi:hypothetical protein
LQEVGQKHSFKNQTGHRTGEALGSGFYWSDHWFSGSLSGFLRSKKIYFILVNAAKNKQIVVQT